MNFWYVQLLKEYFSWLKAGLKIFHTQCLTFIIYLNPCSTYKVMQFTIFFHFKSEGSFNWTTSSQKANIFHQTSLRICTFTKTGFSPRCSRWCTLSGKWCFSFYQNKHTGSRGWKWMVVGSQIMFPWQQWTSQLASCDPLDSGVQLVSDGHLCKSQLSVKFLWLICSLDSNYY